MAASRSAAVFVAKLIVANGYPEIPESFAPRFGDALHNYRSALDHVAWQLVSCGSKPPETLDPRERNRIQFPTYSSRDVFRSNQGSRLPGVEETAIRYLEARHKYVGGEATNDRLLSLADLSNDDKHRTMQTFVGMLNTLENQVTMSGLQIVSYDNPPTRPMLKSGAVVALMEIVLTGDNPEMAMKLKPAVYMADRGWTRLLRGS